MSVERNITKVVSPPEGAAGARTVLHFIGNLGGGGAETMMRNLVTHFVHRGWRQIVVAMRVKCWPQELAELQACGVVVHGLEMDGLLRRGTLTALTGIMKTERPDVVQTWMHHADLVGGVCAWFAGVPKIVWGIHCREVVSNPGDSRLRMAIFEQMLKACSRRLPSKIVSCSDVALDDHVKLGFPRERMRWIPNGIDSQRFRPDAVSRAQQRAGWGIPTEAAVVGFVGRFHEMKQVGVFLRAAEILLQEMSAAHVVLCGGVAEDLSGAEREALARMDLSRVHFVPFRSDPQCLYPALDVFSLSSRTEAFPMTVLEAMACGIPCVTTDVGDCARIIGQTGATVPVGNAEALAAAWLGLLAESSEAKQARRTKTRERILSEFSIERAATAYLRLYEEVVQSI
ncbi:MAG: glycosyltransferase [Verrucomicrobiales bacterium]|nr:glycosyltransferase [Verrucomicrobiales bacterium]